jgi:hypothetical protein
MVWLYPLSDHQLGHAVNTATKPKPEHHSVVEQESKHAVTPCCLARAELKGAGGKVQGIYMFVGHEEPLSCPLLVVWDLEQSIALPVLCKVRQ